MSVTSVSQATAWAASKDALERCEGIEYFRDHPDGNHLPLLVEALKDDASFVVATALEWAVEERAASLVGDLFPYATSIRKLLPINASRPPPAWPVNTATVMPATVPFRTGRHGPRDALAAREEGDPPDGDGQLKFQSQTRGAFSRFLTAREGSDSTRGTWKKSKQKEAALYRRCVNLANSVKDEWLTICDGVPTKLNSGITCPPGMIGSRWRGLRWAAIVAAIGTGLGCGGRSLPPGTAGRIAPAAAPDDRDLMPDILRRYTSCKTYRDRGTVVATHFTPKGSYVEIHRFETLFVRGHGLRFRFTEETGELEAAIWARGDRVRRWASGDEVPSPSLEAAAGTAGHSTELVTWIVPRLLLGVRPTNEPTHIVGWDSGGSAEMGFALLHPRRFAALSIDAKKGIVWRFTVRAPVSESPEYDAKTRAVLPTVLVTYEPSFDVDEATALRELDVPPWPASRTPSEGERE